MKDRGKASGGDGGWHRCVSKVPFLLLNKFMLLSVSVTSFSVVCSEWFYVNSWLKSVVDVYVKIATDYLSRCHRCC